MSDDDPHPFENSPTVTSLSSGELVLRPLLSTDWLRFIHTTYPNTRSQFDLGNSPVHVIDTQQCAKNLKYMQSTVATHGLNSQFLYAFKANKSVEFVDAVSRAGFGVDVASVHEHALARSVCPPSTELSLSGPVKGEEWILRAVAEGCLLSVDSIEELKAIRKLLLKCRPKRPARLTLRVNFEGEQCRFGIEPQSLSGCAELLARSNILMRFEGFAFHLGGYAVETRIEAIKSLLPWIDTFAESGLRSRFLNIGGGLPVQYVEPSDYADYVARHEDEVAYKGIRPTSFYPYGGKLSATAWLDELLSAPVKGGSIASAMKTRELVLLIEPGRAALDQAGVSLFRIAVAKKGAKATTLFLNGSSFNACETWFQSEFLSDPIILPANRQPAHGERRTYYLAGHSCLADDIISRRSFVSGQALGAGDVLLFANTAGYQMDLLENNFHHHPFPSRVVRTSIPDIAASHSSRAFA